MPSEAYIDQVKAEYPAGTKIRLIHMEDIQAPPDGTIGTVRGVDGVGDLLMNWDNGSSLKVVLKEDAIEKISEV